MADAKNSPKITALGAETLRVSVELPLGKQVT